MSENENQELNQGIIAEGLLDRDRWKAVSYLKEAVDASRAGRWAAEADKAGRIVRDAAEAGKPGETVKSGKEAASGGICWREALWRCVVLFQGYEFMTAGRGRKHAGSTAFTYKLKVSSRTGELTDEMVISSRSGKTVTRSSVELALEKYLQVMDEKGYVKGPKSAGEIFGASYLYGIFLRWGVITDEPSAADAAERRPAGRFYRL